MQRVLVWHICLTLGLAFAGSFAFAANTQAWPEAPLEPTKDDCLSLQEVFNRLRLGLHRRMQECLREEPLFGPGIEACKPVSIMAWSQCSSIDSQRCEFEQTFKREVNECWARAQSTPDKERAEALRSVNEKYERAQQIIDAIQDPKSFLEQNLQDFPGPFTRVFGKDSGTFNMPLAQEIYRYAHNQAVAGARFTLNPLIRSIQEDALNRIAEMHRYTLDELEQVTASIESFSTQVPTLAPAPRGLLHLSAPQPLEPVDCRTLSDPARSRALMTNNRELWLDLVSKCSGRQQ